MVDKPPNHPQRGKPGLRLQIAIVDNYPRFPHPSISFSTRLSIIIFPYISGL